MSKVINPVKELIEERISKINGEEREDLNYVHLFFPKLNVLLGTESCLRILNDEDPIKVFEMVGLNSEDYNSISSLIEIGKSIYLKENTLEVLEELDKKSDKIFYGFLNKVRNHMIKTGASNDKIAKFDEQVKEFFFNSNEIFTPCSVYENQISEKKNNVK